MENLGQAESTFTSVCGCPSQHETKTTVDRWSPLDTTFRPGEDVNQDVPSYPEYLIDTLMIVLTELCIRI